jgi:flagellar protein FlbD
VIQLTRLRHGDTFYLNPDLFERVDTHIDTVIRLTDGTEYVVVESADEIARRIAEFRARVIALAAVLGPNACAPTNATDVGRVNAVADQPAGAAAELTAPVDREALTVSWDGRS